MTSYDIPDELQDILDAYVAATPAPTPATLTAWIRRYPQYERELTSLCRTHRRPHRRCRRSRTS